MLSSRRYPVLEGKTHRFQHGHKAGIKRGESRR